MSIDNIDQMEGFVLFSAPVADEHAEAQQGEGGTRGGGSVFDQLAARAAALAINPPPVLTPDYFVPLGAPLFYGGVLNTLVGPGGVMKTTLALKACSAHPTYSLFVSLEKSEPALLSTAQWAKADTSRMLVTTSLAEAEAAIASAPADADLLVTVDSMISVLGALAIDENDASGVAQVEARFKKWREASGVGCVVLLDHTGHSVKDRARGSSRKGQMIQGREWVLRTRGDKRPATGDVVTATCTKDNSGIRGEPWGYVLTEQGPEVFLQAISAVDAVTVRINDDAGTLLTLLADTGGYPSGKQAQADLEARGHPLNGARYKAAAEHLESAGLVERPRPGLGARASVGLRLLPKALTVALAAGQVANDGEDDVPIYRVVREPDAGVSHVPSNASGNTQAEDESRTTDA